MSTSNEHRLKKEESVSEEAVVQYLRAHPEFFERQTQLLTLIKLPHITGGPVSLVERQITLLREKNRQLERKLMDLVSVARDNEHLSSRLHHLALGLMEADGLDAVLGTAQEVLRGEFKADHVFIRLIGETPGAGGLHFIDPGEPGLGLFDGLFESKRPICGRLTREQTAFLFAEHAEEVASAVVVPLTDADRLGLIALGSREQTRFHPGMGTLFLGYLGELVSRAVITELRQA